MYLRQASSDLMSRLENAKKGMGDLADETQKTVIRLDNTINDFSRLANNQFIENVSFLLLKLIARRNIPFI